MDFLVVVVVVPSPMVAFVFLVADGAMADFLCLEAAFESRFWLID
jgi:hypothetical protein